MKTRAWITAACMLAIAPALGAQSLGRAPDAVGDTATSGVGVGTALGSDLHPEPEGFEAWTNMGFALEGILGEPILSGTGSTEADAQAGLDLVDARPNSLALLLVSASNNPTAFKGGVVVPTPAPIQLLMSTDDLGGIQLMFAWPEEIPSGIDIYLQFVIYDPAAVQMFSLSNALVAHTP
ncbi:MAG: hypothetical protein ACYTG2_12910 [Planctomycetota bacterium]